jgi:hypothetical protein
MGSDPISYVDGKAHHSEQCLYTIMPSSQLTSTPTSSSPSASPSVSTSTTNALYASDKTPKFSITKEKKTYNMSNPAPTRISLTKLLKRLIEILSVWPALLLLIVCLWFVLPCRFEKNHGREGVNLRDMKWIGAEGAGFHVRIRLLQTSSRMKTNDDGVQYIGRWYNNTAGPGMEMTFEGGYIDILHN